LTTPKTNTSGVDQAPIRARRAGWVFLLLAFCLFAAVTLPVIVKGAPLLDDFSRCLRPQDPGYWSERLRETGAFRPMKYLEIGIVNGLCRSVPFSFAILVPWLLTLGVALLLRALLRDLRVRPPWPEIGAGLWLLAPLGTESSLWPSALHVSLGLALALLGLRMVIRGRLVFGVVLGLLGCLGVEQLIFAFPMAAWWVSVPHQRWKVLTLSAAVSAGILVLYTALPGTAGRLALPLTERVISVFRDVEAYPIMVATGLGAHSIPTAIQWVFPWSVLVLACGLVAGCSLGPRLLEPSGPNAPPNFRSIAMGVLLLALLNLAVALSFPHPRSPRVFAPSWLALVAFLAIIGSRLTWRRKSLVGGLAGVFIAGAVLSLALSAWVRVRSGDIVERAMTVIAAETPNHGIAAVCGVTRTVVEPAPSGDFSINEFLSFTGDAYEYYTPEVAEIRVGGTYTPGRCPELAGADAIFEFEELTS
jgi:hypothetical protein